jgi:hypothetical protein
MGFEKSPRVLVGLHERGLEKSPRVLVANCFSKIHRQVNN